MSHLYNKTVPDNAVMCLISSIADGTDPNTIDVGLTFDVFADDQAEVERLFGIIMEADFDQIQTVTDDIAGTVYTLNSFQTTGKFNIE